MSEHRTPAKIDKFTGSYRFLSNFYPATVSVCGKSYPSVEHAYQASKFTDDEIIESIRIAATPGIAKSLGREYKSLIRSDWQEISLKVMLELIRQKFQHKELRLLLLSTGSATLIEGNTWNDRFWGVCDGKGENHLGRILMRVRAELQACSPQHATASVNIE